VKRPPARIGRARAQGQTRGPGRQKFYLTYPQRLVREPLIYQLSRKFDVVFNVRGASVNEEIGIIALELDGDPDVIEAAVSWLREQGVTVEPIEKNVIE
jgi:ABC-type methionine transport system ATPase subunit